MILHCRVERVMEKGEAAMRVMIRPSEYPSLTVDVTNTLVAALAKELSRLEEGTPEALWREAEALLEQMCSRAVAGPIARRGERDDALLGRAGVEAPGGLWGRGRFPGPLE